MTNCRGKGVHQCLPQLHYTVQVDVWMEGCMGVHEQLPLLSMCVQRATGIACLLPRKPPLSQSKAALQHSVLHFVRDASQTASLSLGSKG